MRLLLATFSHETNTFSPVPTNIERFCRDGTTLLGGQAAIEFYRGTGTCMGGFLAVAEDIGAEVVVAVCASAPPSGPVDSDAYETCCRMITDEIAKGGFDAFWLDLHGAMVVEGIEDGEGELLRRIRAIDPNTPLCVATWRPTRTCRRFARRGRPAVVLSRPACSSDSRMPMLKWQACRQWSSPTTIRPMPKPWSMN
jgi:microcystin degradation protein MlrC